MTTQSPWREQSPSGDPPTEDQATAGTVVGGRYELIIDIGHGGMGTVWRATDTLLRREVAVKEVILPPTMPQHEKDALCERTMREARAAAALSHPSVVQVFDVVIDADRPWIVMELLEARSLADMVIDDGPLPPRTVAKIGIAMLGALEVAHAAGVLHRDVKPANVLVCDDGRCVLTDFGVARLPTESKLTTPGMVLGSPHFISPERAVGGAFGPPSDLFSLGVTLYTAIEGGPPFDRGDPFETMRAVVEEAPRPARLAGPLKPVLWGLLEKEPERRWDVDRARTALRELLAGALAPPPRRDVEPTDTDPGTIRLPRKQSEQPETPTPPPAIVSGGVGGRAMLDPEESLTDQLARLRADAGLPPEGAAEPVDRLTIEEVTRRIPAARDTAGPARPDWATRPSWAGGESWGGSGAAARSRRAELSGPARSGATQRHAHVGRRRAPTRTSKVLAQVSDRRNRSRVIVISGLIAVLLAVAISAWALSRGPDSGPPPADPVPPTPTPLIDVQEYRERGIAVNVPAGWTRGGANSYVDFQDPASARWVRINIEETSGTATHLLENAESGLRDPARCAAPYTRVALQEAELGGVVGAELEYTCGTGDTMRHGIWRAVVVQGMAYHFYLTALDKDFADSLIIYDEMVRSFVFT